MINGNFNLLWVSNWLTCRTWNGIIAKLLESIVLNLSIYPLCWVSSLGLDLMGFELVCPDLLSWPLSHLVMALALWVLASSSFGCGLDIVGPSSLIDMGDTVVCSRYSFELNAYQLELFTIAYVMPNVTFVLIVHSICLANLMLLVFCCGRFSSPVIW